MFRRWLRILAVGKSIILHDLLEIVGLLCGGRARSPRLGECSLGGASVTGSGIPETAIRLQLVIARLGRPCIGRATHENKSGDFLCYFSGAINSANGVGPR